MKYKEHINSMKSIISSGVTNTANFRGLNIYSNPGIVLSNSLDYESDYKFKVNSVEDAALIAGDILEAEVSEVSLTEMFPNLNKDATIYFHLFPAPPGV